MTHTQTINFGVRLTRKHVGSNPDECGTVAQWQQLLNELYGQMPFPSLWGLLKLVIWHMDHPEQDAMVAAGQFCLMDYDPNTPGYQGAAGLQWDDQLHIGAYPSGFSPDYSGPPRSITSALASAFSVLDHEAGHFYFGQSRHGKDDDDITRKTRAHFNALRPQQAAGGNEYEDAAEVYRAICGTNARRGTFSDGKRFVASPELAALVRCLYWLNHNLRGCWVASVAPMNGGVQYQVWVGWRWVWRFVSASNWAGQEYDPATNSWKRI